MKVYLVWDGYEDVAAVFLSELNATKFVDKLIWEQGKRRENLSVIEMDVADAP